MAGNDLASEVQVGAQGRLVIPANLRRALDLRAGERLVARRVGDAIVLERREAIERRMQARFAEVPDDVDLAAELIADRAREAQREGDER
jgi:AbrB family looped-hinge helix DNA binding protein